jgi:CheY-like chemotaxis protein
MNPTHGKRPLTILCAEESEFLRTVLAYCLTRAGHLVDTATNGFEAWDKMMADLGHYDVLVTGHSMPVLTGLELVELLHAAKYPGRMFARGSAVSRYERERYEIFGIEQIIMETSQPSAVLEALEACPAQ